MPDRNKYRHSSVYYVKGVIRLKMLWNIFFISLFALVTFFGLGPVLMADGVLKERILTAAVVIAIYVFLSILYKKIVFRKN
ncbi:DUF6954 family protein [Bacillus sp. B-jedd]|uniref:DUF6954 family protein n=1 Tax=Bacillus sp. B-jedd TaxID=1476857 RepID=UPI00051559DC|nr:hypothetical protein [Bacillus sp. B-jedd]CEG28225.1 hypothetical protein BN1002_03109 [Bacillus sp. B-jedd]